MNHIHYDDCVGKLSFVKTLSWLKRPLIVDEVILGYGKVLYPNTLRAPFKLIDSWRIATLIAFKARQNVDEKLSF